MSTSKLLLELFSEELPAKTQITAEKDFKILFEKEFKNHNINYSNIDVYTSPRRITIYINDIISTVNTDEELIKGPSINSGTNALEGFCKKHNIKNSDIKIDGDYYFYIKPATTIYVKDILLGLLPNIIKKYSFKKSMVWDDSLISWARPLRNIMCLFDNEVLEIKYGHLKANNITYGHRLSSQSNYQGKQLEIKSADFKAYENLLEHHKVIVDQDKRKELIKEGINKVISDKHDCKLLEDENLLNEINGIVEYPNVMIEAIPNFEQFFKVLPYELITSVMKNHQKYFSVKYKTNDELAPFFIFVSNNYEHTNADSIKKGNQLALLARLDDALFIYNEDMNNSHIYIGHIHNEKMRDLLTNKTFFEGLGSLYDKIKRLEEVILNSIGNPKYLTYPLEEFGQYFYEAIIHCKDDLVLETVKEYPELQGNIASTIDNPNIVNNLELYQKIIKEHYKPQDANDELPSNLHAIILSLADKMDNLVGFMITGVRATSSSDPYGLRRLAIAIIRLITVFYDDDNTLKDCSIFYGKGGDTEYENLLSKILDNSIKSYKKINNMVISDEEKIKNDITKFIEDRLYNYLKIQNPEIEELIKPFIKCNSIYGFDKISTLLEFKQDASDITGTYKRIIGVLGKSDYLNNKLQNTKMTSRDIEFNNEIERRDDRIEEYDGVFKNNLEAMLLGYTTLVNDYMDNTLINDADAEVANNRRIILSKAKSLFTKHFDFE